MLYIFQDSILPHTKPLSMGKLYSELLDYGVYDSAAFCSYLVHIWQRTFKAVMKETIVMKEQKNIVNVQIEVKHFIKTSRKFLHAFQKNLCLPCKAFWPAVKPYKDESDEKGCCLICWTDL